MKKVFSISLSILLLTALLHISVAVHYCGGNIVDSRVSLSGKLASCGMENEGKELTLPGTYMISHCCDNIVTFCGTDSNYTPSFSFIPETYQYNFQVFAIPLAITYNSPADLIPSYTDVSSPGVFRSTSVDLSDICVFRI